MKSTERAAKRVKIEPRYRHHCDRCECLGEVSINDVTANVFVCENLVIARFSDDPADYEAQPMTSLDATSDVFLLAAFRLYLDVVGTAPLPKSELIYGTALKS